MLSRSIETRVPAEAKPDEIVDRSSTSRETSRVGELATSRGVSHAEPFLMVAQSSAWKVEPY